MAACLMLDVANVPRSRKSTNRQPRRHSPRPSLTQFVRRIINCSASVCGRVCLCDCVWTCLSVRLFLDVSVCATVCGRVCLCDCLWPCLSVRLFVAVSVCATVCGRVCLCDCLWPCMSVRLFVAVSLCATVCGRVCLCDCLWTCLSVRLFVDVSVCATVCGRVCLCDCLWTCLSVRLFVAVSVYTTVCLSVGKHITRCTSVVREVRGTSARIADLVSFVCLLSRSATLIPYLYVTMSWYFSNCLRCLLSL